MTDKIFPFLTERKPSSPLPEFEGIDQRNPGDARLPSGMTVAEAIRQAENWWTKKGQKYFREHLTPGNKGAGFLDQDPTSENHLPSGLMLARNWEDLTVMERWAVVRVWHHFYVAVPDMELGTAGFKAYDIEPLPLPDDDETEGGDDVEAPQEVQE